MSAVYKAFPIFGIPDVIAHSHIIYLVPSLLAFDSFMKTGGNCSFLYDHYHKIEARLCSAALPAMLNVGFAMLLNALFGIVMVSIAEEDAK